MRRGKYEAKAEEEEEEQEEGRKGKEAGYEEGKERMGEYKELYWMALKEVIRKKTSYMVSDYIRMDKSARMLKRGGKTVLN